MTRGNTYAVVMQDLFSKWPEVIPILDVTAKTVAEAILNPIGRWGPPEMIVSDQGREFVAELHQELARRLGIKRSFSTPGHPQTNGQVEHFNQTLKSMMACYANTKQDNWDVYMLLLLYTYHTSPQKSMGVSLYQVLFRQLAPPLEGSRRSLDNVKPSDEWIAELREAQQIIHDQVTSAQDQSKDEMVQRHHKRKGGTYAPGDRVLVQQPTKGRARKLAKKWTGPFDVVQQASPQVVVLRHPKGHNFKLNMERIKPFREKQNTKEEKPQPAPTSMNEEYEIEAIIDHHNWRKGHEYKVRWVGYTTHNDTWVPATNVQANRLIQDYLDSHQLQGGTATVLA